MVDDQQVPHLLAIPFFFRGHEIPLLHLCRHFKSRGAKFLVTILRTSRSKPTAPPKDLAGFVRFEEFPDDINLPAERNLELFIQFFKRFQGELGDFVLDRWQCRPVTCVICDVLVEWGERVARHLGVPWIAFWTSTVLEMAMASHVPRLIAENAIKDPESIIKIPGLPDFQVRDYVTLSNVINPNFPMKFMIESLVDTVRRTAGADMILANSSGLLEDDAIKTLESSGIKVTPVGPLHLIDQDNDPKDPDKVISWLDEQDPASVLYICFGTVAPMPVGQMEELAMALDSTGVSFLWVVRHDHLKDIPPGFTAKHGISNGTNGTNGGCTARHRGLLTDWVTQPRVLGHRAVGGFLTHCGWNSVMESITAGVPMITRPLMGDQTLTAAMLRQASMPAIALPTSKGGAVTKTEIVAAIEELMVRERGAELRRRAGDAAALVRSGMENGCLDSLVTELNILAKNPKIQHIRFA